jgi:predicted CopG family antitoxin
VRYPIQMHVMISPGMDAYLRNRAEKEERSVGDVVRRMLVKAARRRLVEQEQAEEIPETSAAPG